MSFDSYVVFNFKESKECEEARRTIEDWCLCKNYKFSAFNTVQNLKNYLSAVEKNDRSLLITLGGDGTFLQAADLAANYSIPLLGVNVGSLGFLSSLKGGNVKDGLEEIEKENLDRRKLTRLSAEFTDISKDPFPQTVLNEFLFSRRGLTDFGIFELYVEGDSAGTYPGDGLIISTPTGSTAYSLAGGGPLMVPQTDAFCITPLNIHKLGHRPIVIPSDMELVVRPKTEARLMGDGDEITSLKKGDEVLIKKSDTRTEIVVPHGASGFFDIVERKLVDDCARGSRSG